MTPCGSIALPLGLERVDLQTVLGRVDLNAVLERVDVDQIIDRVDISRILVRLDLEVIVALVNVLISQLDLNAVISRLDMDQIIAKVDVNAIIERVDIDQLMQRTELGPIIASASSGAASEAVDAVRSAGVGLDDFVHRWMNRFLRRSRTTWPSGPPLLIAEIAYDYNEAKTSVRENPNQEGGEARQRSSGATPAAPDGLPGTVTLGAWLHTGQFADQRLDNTGRLLAATGGTPLQHSGNFGVYAIIDQLLWRAAGNNGELRGFLRAVAAPSDRNLIDRYFDAGLTYKGLFDSRVQLPHFL